MAASSVSKQPASPLQEAKQQLVRDSIADAALSLFAAKGFEETTVDDIAKAAGVSRRSFFRYFSSKNDVMAQPIAAYGIALSEAILAAPRTYTPLEVVRDAVLRIAVAGAAYPRTRQTIQVSKTSVAARQAQLSGSGDIEDRVAQAFASRLENASAVDATPRLLASLTLSILDVTFKVWFDENAPDISVTAEQVMATLTHLVCDGSSRSRTASRPSR